MGIIVQKKRPDPSKVQAITKFLLSKDGHAPLSEIGSKFSVKRSWLEDADFVFNVADKNGQCCVAPPGHDAPELEGIPEVVPLEDLSEIVNYVNEKGGRARLSTLRAKFNVRKPQLRQAGFVLSRRPAGAATVGVSIATSSRQAARHRRRAASSSRNVCRKWSCRCRRSLPS